MRIRTILTLFATSLIVASCQTANGKAAEPPHEIRVVRLDHTQASSMAETLGKLAAGSELTIAAAPEQNALLLRGTEAQIAQTLNLIAQLDVASRGVAERNDGQAAGSQPGFANALVIYCRHCKAKELAATINEMLPNADQVAGPNRVTVIPHVEHNSLLISGPSEKLTQLRKLVEKLDRKAS